MNSSITRKPSFQLQNPQPSKRARQSSSALQIETALDDAVMNEIRQTPSNKNDIVIAPSPKKETPPRPSKSSCPSSTSLLDLLGPSTILWHPSTNARLPAHAVLQPNNSQVDKMILLYFSASWCKPCRYFTEKLIQFYKAVKARRQSQLQMMQSQLQQQQHHQLQPDLEVILVSFDHLEPCFRQYAEKMPWWCIDFRRRDLVDVLATHYGQLGIPHCSILDRDGSTVVVADAVEDVTLDPEGVNFPWATVSITMPKTTTVPTTAASAAAVVACTISCPPSAISLMKSTSSPPITTNSTTLGETRPRTLQSLLPVTYLKNVTTTSTTTMAGAAAATTSTSTTQKQEIQRNDINDLRGKYLLLYFGASWCGPCRKFKQKFSDAHDHVVRALGASSKDPREEVECLFVSADDSHAEFEEYWAKHLPTLGAIPYDDEASRKGLVKRLNVQSFPALFILSPVLGEDPRTADRDVIEYSQILSLVDAAGSKARDNSGKTSMTEDTNAPGGGSADFPRPPQVCGDLNQAPSLLDDLNTAKCCIVFCESANEAEQEDLVEAVQTAALQLASANHDHIPFACATCFIAASSRTNALDSQDGCNKVAAVEATTKPSSSSVADAGANQGEGHTAIKFYWVLRSTQVSHAMRQAVQLGDRTDRIQMVLTDFGNNGTYYVYDPQQQQQQASTALPRMEEDKDDSHIHIHNDNDTMMMDYEDEITMDTILSFVASPGKRYLMPSS